MPSWFDGAGMNQYLFIDDGTTLDYAAGSG
jgi:hypothetical protein